MIIYGTRATHVLTETLPATCPNCNTAHSVEMAVFQRYAHIFWIPTFPIGKIVATECSHCRQVLEKNDMPQSWRTYSKTITSKAKAPFWTFSGGAIIATLIVFSMINGSQENKKKAERIAQPKAGDVYEWRTDEGQYTLMRIKDVQNDTLYVQMSAYETNKQSGLGEISAKGEAAYDTIFTIGIPKADIQKKFAEGRILNVR